MMALKCQECGAPLKGEVEDGYIVCEYCGTINIVGPAYPIPRPPLVPDGKRRRVLPGRVPPRKKYPLLGVLRELEREGVIPKKEFRLYTLQAIRAGRRPRVAVVIALRRLIQERRVDRNQLYNALIRAGIARERIERLFR